MYKKKLGQTYYTNRHSCFLLQYHIVLVTKYRRPVLTGAVKELVYQVIQDIFDEKDLVCVLSIENPQSRKENSLLSDREIPIIRKKHVESFRFFPYLVGKKAAFTAFCPIG